MDSNNKKGLDLIRERVMKIAENYRLISQLFPKMVPKELKKYGYAYILYLEGNAPQCIIGELATSENDFHYGDGPGFVAFLTANAPQGFSDVLYVIHLYKAKELYSGDVAKHSGFTPNAVADDMLKESRGYLLWHYQLENLIRLFETDPRKVVEIRMGINAKRANLFKQTSKFKLSENLSLNDIVSERAFEGCTSHPNIRGAYYLLNTLGLL